MLQGNIYRLLVSFVLSLVLWQSHSLVNLTVCLLCFSSCVDGFYYRFVLPSYLRLSLIVARQYFNFCPTHYIPNSLSSKLFPFFLSLATSSSVISWCQILQSIRFSLWHFHRVLVSYLVAWPSIWVCLVFSHNWIKVGHFWQAYYRSDDVPFLVYSSRGTWCIHYLLMADQQYFKEDFQNRSYSIS